jgi:hypothetical protein
MGKNRYPKARVRRRLTLYSYGGELLLDNVAREQGLRMVREEKWVALRDAETKDIIGFQYRACRNMTASLERVPCEAIAKVSSRAISHAEREALLGLRGESRTASMSEERKLKLMADAAMKNRRFSPEDFVERSVEKVKVYAGTH